MINKNIQEGKVNIQKVSHAQRNADIDSILCGLTAKQASIYEKRDSANMGEYLEYIVCIISTYVGEQMKADEALLLPKLQKEFTREIYAYTASFVNVSVCESDIPNSRWLLSQLHVHFENMLEVQSRQRRYGTLIYHKSCDLIHVLSSALGKGQIRAEIGNTHKPDSHDNQAQQHSTPTLVQQMQTVVLHINTKLHEQAKLQRDSFNETPENIASLNLTGAWENTDPELLNFLTMMTQPVRHSRRKLFESSPVPMEQNTHTKKVRLFYALSVLLFCTNTTSTCSSDRGGVMPWRHTRIGLNRLGAAACFDTVNRLATHIVKRRVTEGIKSDLAPQRFAAVSIDNIDILQPYGFVSCLDATRSWHGTSVQCTHPLPVSGHLTPDDVLTPATVSGATNKRMCSSPVNTREKHKRRRRTLTEHASPHSTMVTESQEPTTSLSNPFQTTNTAEYANSSVMLKLEDFKPNFAEQSALNTLQNDLFLCIMLRKAGSTLSMQPFPGLQSLVNCVRHQAAEKEVSHITYVEIVSEKADSKPTIMGVISRLQTTFVEELKQKYVLVVGDAKTYNLLQAICYEYKSYLKWLIPFPGDWHVLFNYQKALMKPYADAGLATLAKAAGHRAETLTSLLQASNFRRTHEFLLQSFDALYSSHM